MTDKDDRNLKIELAKDIEDNRENYSKKYGETFLEIDELLKFIFKTKDKKEVEGAALSIFRTMIDSNMDGSKISKKILKYINTLY